MSARSKETSVSDSPVEPHDLSEHEDVIPARPSAMAESKKVLASAMFCAGFGQMRRFPKMIGAVGHSS
jgi:hypothetical protein